jgi:hypothetical protein
VNNVVANVAGNIELDELPLPASFFEGSKIFPAVFDRVIKVTLSIKPERRTSIYRARNRASGFSTRSNNVASLQRATTGLPRTTLPSFNLRQSGYGYALMSAA